MISARPQSQALGRQAQATMKALNTGELKITISLPPPQMLPDKKQYLLDSFDSDSAAPDGYFQFSGSMKEAVIQLKIMKIEDKKKAIHAIEQTVFYGHN